MEKKDVIIGLEILRGLEDSQVNVSYINDAIKFIENHPVSSTTDAGSSGASGVVKGGNQEGGMFLKADDIKVRLRQFIQREKDIAVHDRSVFKDEYICIINERMSDLKTLSVLVEGS